MSVQLLELDVYLYNRADAHSHQESFGTVESYYESQSTQQVRRLFWDIFQDVVWKI